MKAKLLLLPCSLAGLVTVGAASAADDREGRVIEEVIVTVQKRSQSVQDIPVAVSAFTDEMRDLIGLRTVQDFANFTPGVSYSVSLDRMFVRGVGRYTNNLATSAAVANYGDGFYNSSNHQASGSPLFNQRVEVLRGPQGTLYGRNSIGGAINIITKRPTDTFKGEVRARMANLGRQDAEALLSGPISDSIGFLIGGARARQEEGYVSNIAGDDEEGKQDDSYGIAQLSMKFGDAVDVWVKYAHSEWNQGWGNSINTFPYVTNVRCTPTPPSTSCATLLNPGNLGPSALFNTGVRIVNGVETPLNPASPQYLTQNPGVRNPRQTNHDTPNHEDLNDNEVVLEVVGHLGFADLKYVGGYREYLYELVTDFDNSDRKSYTYTPPSGTNPVEVFTQVSSLYVEDKHYYSNELNLISTNDGPLQWVVGVYGYTEKYEQPVTVGTPGQVQLRTPVFPAAAPPFTAAAPNPNGTYSATDHHITINSLAGFGQVDYSFTEQWKASLGLRYTRDKKYGDEFARYVTWNPTNSGSLTPAFDISATSFGPNGGVPGGPNGSYMRHLAGEWHATTGTAGIEWSPNDDILGYFRYTRGYKDGGLNAGSIVALPYTDPEFINAYEVGWKQELGGRLVANAAVFFYDYKDAQIPLTIVRTGLPNLTQTFNLDEEVLGFELETTWRATDSLQLLLNYSFLDTEITDTGCYTDALDGTVIGPNLCPGGGHFVEGNRVPSSPRNKVAFNALYSIDFAPGSLIFSGSWTWRDTVYSSIFNRQEWRADSYDQADFRVTWAAAQDKYSIIGYVRNAFDEEGVDAINATSTAAGITRSFSLNPPRQYGVELQYRFGD